MTLEEKIRNALAGHGPDAEGKLALYNWGLSLVTNQTRERNQHLTEEEIQILVSGTYTAPDGAVTNFALPADLQGDVK